MNAVIMAGGFGTRLRPITCNIPKPMVPLANMPMMEHIVNLLKKYDLKQIVSVLYFQPEVITKHFGDGSDFGIKMDYVMATADYGTAGSIKNSEEHLKGKRFIIISGDVLTDFDLSAAIRFHEERKSMATIVLTRVANPLEYGVVIAGDDGKIERFLEKPSWGEVFSDTINTGIYILEPEIFDHIPAKTEFDFSKNLFPLMLKEKLPLYGYIAEGYWKDIGDINEYRLAHKDVLNGNVQIQIPGERLNVIGRDAWVGANTKMGRRVNLKGGVIIGANCVIEDGVELENSVIGDGCIVKGGAKVVDSILWERVYVGNKAHITEGIVGSDTHVRDGATLEAGVVISEECRIGDHSTVRSNVKIWPRKVVEDGSTVFSSIVWSDKWTKSLFSNYGISGLGNLEITPELAAKVGAAFGSTLPKGASVNCSRSSHKICRIINRALICGLTSAGVNVADLRVMPSPVARFKPTAFRRIGGLHVGIATNDPNQVEIRIFDAEGRELAPTSQKSVERLFNREDFRRVSMHDVGDIVFPPRVSEFYSNELLNNIDVDVVRKRTLKVVVDFAYSGASGIFSAFLGKLGCEVIALNAFQDEEKVQKTSGNVKGALDNVASIVKSLGADVGLLLDSEAEKITIIDDEGRPMLGEVALLAWIKLIFDMSPNARVAVPVSATDAIDLLAKKCGGTVIRTKTNGRALMTAAVSDNVSFCGNGEGGTIFPAFQAVFDGMISTAKLLEILARAGKPLSKLVDDLPKFHTRTKNIPCPWEAKGKVMRQAMEFAKDRKTQLIDGVKVLLDDGEWVLILPDPDKPFVTITVEAGSEKRADDLLSKSVNDVDHWKKADS